MGASVGLRVGETVGFFVGASVGLRVGETVGLFVGASVGLRVGESVGLFVGASVGLRVGESVGLFVGASVGRRVGPGVVAAAAVSVMVFEILTAPFPVAHPALSVKSEPSEGAVRATELLLTARVYPLEDTEHFENESTFTSRMYWPLVLERTAVRDSPGT